MERIRYQPRLLFILFIGLGVIPCRETRADVRLPGFFNDHMVLQQQMKIKVWGWSDPGESVTVSVGDQSATAQGGDDGKWSVELPAQEASKTPTKLTVQGNNTIEINDVLIGEVWLCSGQSNMEWNVKSSTNAEHEISSANHPLIRHVKFGHRPSMTPIDDVKGQWQVCSPETVGGFTAAGYFMAGRLHAELDVPIGLINSSWGGTRVEPWTPPIGFEKTPALQDIYQSILGRTVGTQSYETALSNHIKATEEWVAKARNEQGNSERVEPSPAFPGSLLPFQSHQDPTMLYNGMIHAIVGYPIRGAIWYQGESNHNEGMLYFEKKKALINGWRELWGQGDFPFYFVQIAPFEYGNEDPTILANFWEAQAAVEQLPNTGMVVINDIATLNNIHPPNKQDVGSRLAGLALKHDYGRKDVVANSPTFDKLEIVDGALKVHFRDTGGGLKTRDGQSPSHFEVIGNDSDGFKPAVAAIDGDQCDIDFGGSELTRGISIRMAQVGRAQPDRWNGIASWSGSWRRSTEQIGIVQQLNAPI